MAIGRVSLGPLVRTVVAATRQELDGLVTAAIADGWQPIGNPSELRVGGKQQPDRAKWMQGMRKG